MKVKINASIHKCTFVSQSTSGTQNIKEKQKISITIIVNVLGGVAAKNITTFTLTSKLQRQVPIEFISPDKKVQPHKKHKDIKHLHAPEFVLT